MGWGDIDTALIGTAHIVSAVFGVEPADFLADRKGPPSHVHARQAVAYILMTEGGFQREAIARAMNRHHSTIQHGIARIEAHRDNPDVDRGFARLGQMYRELRDSASPIPAALAQEPA